jgi:hypothetical protein
MKLGIDPFFTAIIKAKIRGGAAVDLFAVGGVAGLAALRLQRVPIKGTVARLKY